MTAKIPSEEEIKALRKKLSEKDIDILKALEVVATYGGGRLTATTEELAKATGISVEECELRCHLLVMLDLVEGSTDHDPKDTLDEDSGS